LVEQRTENPRVGSSILPLAMIISYGVPEVAPRFFIAARK
jgi:hypothetical protein